MDARIPLLLYALAACAVESPAPSDERAGLSAASVAAMQARIERDGEAAADELVGLVMASPVALPGGELDRLGQLLIERSDRERLLAHLRERCMARPDDANLAAWLARLEDEGDAVLRGSDVLGY